MLALLDRRPRLTRDEIYAGKMAEFEMWRKACCRFQACNWPTTTFDEVLSSYSCWRFWRWIDDPDSAGIFKMSTTHFTTALVGCGFKVCRFRNCEHVFNLVLIREPEDHAPQYQEC